jgi:hypothetical protein
MSRIKDYLFDLQEKQKDEYLAKVLGITYDELQELDYDMDTEESNEGLINNYVITFSDDSPKEILSKIKNLDENNAVWIPPWDLENDDYYEEQYEAITSNKDYLERFQSEIEAAKKLNEVELEDKGLEAILKRQIYISIIGAVETFLSETFINLVDENDEYFRSFVETFPDFKQRKFELSQIFQEQERIKDTVKKVLLDIIYHHLAKVGNMYASTFKIEFPDIAELSKCVSIRHDLVHRNGKTKEGEDVVIDKAAVEDLLGKVKPFVEEISEKLKLQE